MQVVIVDEHRFRAMGTGCHVQVVGAPHGACDVAEAVVDGDEARWSRFRPDSEIRRGVPGVAGPVSEETAELAALALEALDRTDGWFDPRLGGHLCAAGYDRTLDLVQTGAPIPPRTAPPLPAVRPAIGRRADGPTLTVPPGVELDLGGIAKGHSADRALAAVLATGAHGACINLGGDLRCAGASPTGDGWWCALDHGPGAAASALAIGLAHGAVATSTTRRRRWTTTCGEAHHLLDPHTGHPAGNDRRSATVVAATAATAEVLTKVALLAPWDDAERLLAAEGGVGLVSLDDGSTRAIGDIAPLLADRASLPEETSSCT